VFNQGQALKEPLYFLRCRRQEELARPQRVLFLSFKKKRKLFLGKTPMSRGSFRMLP